MEQDHKVVLLTGLTGYVATHIAKLLLEKLPSNYKLKATVRNKSNLDKLKTFIADVGEENFKKIELVEMDLNNSDSIISALEGVTHVLHVASPINPSDFTKYEDYVDPVIAGTKALIEGVKKHHIKKLIVTSSCLCILGKLPKPDNSTYDETDFSEITGTEGYVDSKTHEERLILEFIKSQENEAHKTEVVIIAGAFITGPPLLNTSCSSMSHIGGMLLGKWPAIPNIRLPIADVRDVAEAHVTALLKEGLHGQRIAISQETITFPEIAKILHNNFAKYGYPVSEHTADSSLLPEAQRKMADKHFTLDNTKSKDILGLTYPHTVEQSLVEMV
jgi:dihydroflavonol-4-reductase